MAARYGVHLGWRVAETEQRFVLRARSRIVTSVIGYPLGGCLAVLGIVGIPYAVFEGAGNDWTLFAGFAGFGLVILWNVWATNRRRIMVTEQMVTVVQPFSRYEMPWSALSNIELDTQMTKGWYYQLTFVTPTDRIVAQAPAGGRRVMTELRDRILRARPESPTNQVQAGDESPANDASPADSP